MEHLRLYPRYRRVTRRLAPSPKIVTGSPSELARLLRSTARALDGRIRLLADENTAAAAPELVDAIAGGSATILPGSPVVVPDIDIAERIAREAAEAGSRAMVVIGGGTLTDIGKYAAEQADLELLCVPSAASVDAYTSARSALRIAGYHRTPTSRVPSVILASPPVVAEAPRALTLAGLGDLVAKVIARLDWQLGALMTDEAFSAREAEWCAGVARHALARLRREGLPRAAFAALDALLVTGRAMRVFGSSRPAASAEHTMAHLWEVAFDAGDGTGHSAPAGHYHGLLVARAAGSVVAAYRWILGRILASASAGPSLPGEAPHELDCRWQELVPQDMQPFLAKMQEETTRAPLDARAIADRRARLAAHRETIITLADRAITDAERGLDALVRAGIEDHLPQIPAHWVGRSIQWVRYLRGRYSMFNLAFEMGWEPELLAFLGAS